MDSDDSLSEAMKQILESMTIDERVKLSEETDDKGDFLSKVAELESSARGYCMFGGLEDVLGLLGGTEFESDGEEDDDDDDDDEDDGAVEASHLVATAVYHSSLAIDIRVFAACPATRYSDLGYVKSEPATEPANAASRYPDVLDLHL
ncbi:hypothetical protein LTR17_005329 [Elasticomyces elasticus]|nr:hypothetical protein LTR17_005329 [Elasticomyces elasticus]